MDEGPPAQRSLQSQTVFALGQKQTFAPQKVMSAYPQKRTLQWDTRGKKPNDPLEGFRVPLFGKPLIRLLWRSPLGTATPCLNFQAVSVELSDRTAMSAFGAKAGQWLISDLCQSDEFFGRCGRKSEKFEIRGDLLE
jgi:hypothetical protein